MNRIFPAIVKPSAGDRAMAHSHRLKIDLWHRPADDDGPASTFADFELSGSIEMNDGIGPAILRDLLASFRTTHRDGGESEASHA